MDFSGFPGLAGKTANITAGGEIQPPVSPMDVEWTANRVVDSPRMFSLYRRFGNWFGIFCIAAVIVLMAIGMRNRHEIRHSSYGLA